MRERTPSEFDWGYASGVEGPGVGSRLGDYVLGDQIGAGGMGTVYRVRDRTGRGLALKLLPARATAADQQRFEREGQVTASLQHPGIVGTHDAGVADGRAFIVFELVVGRDLEQAFPELERGELLRILRDAAAAVGYAHSQGVIHRDLKPANLLLDEQGAVHVADFGVARAANLERMTLSGALVGTPSAMAPEQINGEQALWGPQLDVWALGVILYRVLTGTMPFAQAVSLAELAVAITHRELEPPRKIDPTVSPALEAVCLKALSKKPDDRHPDASAFAADLGRALEAGPAQPRRRAALVIFVGSLLALAGLGVAVVHTDPPPPSAGVEPAPAPIDPGTAPAAQALALAHGALERVPSEGTDALLAAIERLRAAGGAPELLVLREAIVSAAEERFSDTPERVIPLLRALGRVGPASRSAAETRLARQVFQHTIARLDPDPASTLPWLEALADAGLRVGDPLLESEFLSIACIKVSFGSSDAVYWRQLVFASRLDLCAFKTPHFNRKGAVLNQATCPWSRRTQDPWKRYVTLRVQMREGELTPATRDELQALLLGPNPSIALGPVHWADTAAELALLVPEGVRWRLLAEASRRDPRNPVVPHIRARLLAAAGHLAEAVVAMERAIDLYPTRANPRHVQFPFREAHLLLLAFQIKLDRRRDARRTYELLKRLNPSSAAGQAREHPWLAGSD